MAYQVEGCRDGGDSHDGWNKGQGKCPSERQEFFGTRNQSLPTIRFPE